MNKVGIVWDFDGTLAPEDSTMKTVEILSDGQMSGDEFFRRVHQLNGRPHRGETVEQQWKHIQALDAPTWMYVLSREAFSRNRPLNAEFFQKFVVPKIELYPNVIKFLQTLKDLENREEYRKVSLTIHHYIVSAGLKELIEQVFPAGLIDETYGCRYVIASDAPGDAPESIPVYCVDETGKTRALFEISKGSLKSQKREVNRRVKKKALPFENMMFIGDGDTDIPALSLTRERGGMAVVVYNPDTAPQKINDKLRMMRTDKRADLITPADFSLKGELFHFLRSRCEQIRQKCEAEIIP